MVARRVSSPFQLLAVFTLALSISVSEAKIKYRTGDTVEWGSVDPADISASEDEVENKDVIAQALVRGKQAWKGHGDVDTLRAKRKQKKKEEAVNKVQKVICGQENLSILCDMLRSDKMRFARSSGVHLF